MRFDVLGRIITARVASIRARRLAGLPRRRLHVRVPARARSTSAPHTYISALQGPRDADARARMQAQLVGQFPNVSVIDLREVLQTVQASSTTSRSR